jgi:hypothetical protein
MRLIPRLLVFGCVLASATTVAAQEKFTGKCSQGKPDPNYVLPVGDRPNHTMMLGKVTCTWSAGEIAGVALKEEADTVVSDLSGTTSHDRGYGVGSTADGDKYYVRFDGTTTFKGEAPVDATCKWAFYGGTGKLKGLTGKGTCSGKFDATGAAVFDIVGEYSIAAPKPK